MDENFLLTLETLSLNREITRGASARGVFAIKQRHSGTYLNVNEEQLSTLDAFRSPQTVPQMLSRAIHRRSCLELSEFYELILKAHRAGVLTNEGSLRAPSAPSALRRGFPFPGSLAIVWASVALAGLVGGIAVRPPQALPGIVGAVIGWALLCVALSAGHFFAAMVLRTAGAQVLRARFIWASPLPRFVADLSDACMQPLKMRLAAALMPSTPLISAAAVGLALSADWAFVPLIGALVLLNPRGPAIEALRLFFGQAPRLDTDHEFIFSSNRWPRRRLRAFLRFDDAVSTAWHLGCSLVWIWMAIRVIYSTAGVPLHDTWGRPVFWQGVAAVVIGGVGLAGFIILTTLAAIAVRRRGARIFAQTRRRARRWRAPSASVLGEAELHQTMGLSPLFRTLDPIAQAAVADNFDLARHKAWTTLVTTQRSPGHVLLIAKGSAAAYRRHADGRKEKIQTLIEGDLIGAQPLVDPDQPIFEVESRTPLVALTLSYEDFENGVIKRLGRERTHRLAHACSFLRSLPLCSGWHLTSVTRLADLAEARVFEVGSRVVGFGDEPWTFHVIWEGQFELKRNGRLIKRLGSGDFFGETDLLQNSASNVDVIATQKTRALCVPRTEFLRFVTHNHRVALSLERIASERLGHALFPLQASFEVR